ncbi:phage holin family protein [Glycomyces luteolus]|uniref:Phage holin family protein n=1 Tax=Glycomyces luteolus TaxID=2670330 RepID=A0A9X3SNR1_9ACTN|nr:phage holin family protein [Glycomyces luteolus]MDA1358121.1 phage holin family protein [Glycomyces luteolus]
MEVRHDPQAQALRATEREHGGWGEYDSREGPEHGWGRRDRNEPQRSVGAIVGDLTSQVAHLARVEAQLAAREMGDKARRGAFGGGMFALAGVIAIYGGAALALAAGIALALVWPAWLAALVMGVALLAIAGIFGLVGRAKLRAAMPPVPDETMEHAREDARALRGRMER